MPSRFVTTPGGASANTVVELNVLLATAIDLQAQLKQSHWNVRGPGLADLHAVFDRAATDFGRHADRLAERISSIGGYAAGTVRNAELRSLLVPFPSQTCDAAQNVAATSAALELYKAAMRTAIVASRGRGDLATAKLLSTSIADIDRNLRWVTQAYRQASDLPAVGPAPQTDASETSMRDRIIAWVNGDTAADAYPGPR